MDYVTKKILIVDDRDYPQFEMKLVREHKNTEILYGKAIPSYLLEGNNTWNFYKKMSATFVNKDLEQQLKFLEKQMKGGKEGLIILDRVMRYKDFNSTFYNILQSNHTVVVKMSHLIEKKWIGFETIPKYYLKQFDYIFLYNLKRFLLMNQHGE